MTERFSTRRRHVAASAKPWPSPGDRAAAGVPCPLVDPPGGAWRSRAAAQRALCAGRRCRQHPNGSFCNASLGNGAPVVAPHAVRGRNVPCRQRADMRHPGQETGCSGGPVRVRGANVTWNPGSRAATFLREPRVSARAGTDEASGAIRTCGAVACRRGNDPACRDSPGRSKATSRASSWRDVGESRGVNRPTAPGFATTGRAGDRSRRPRR